MRLSGWWMRKPWMGQCLGWALLLATVLPASSLALPPVPVQPMVPLSSPVISGLADLPLLYPVISAQIVAGELQIATPPGSQLLIKNRFLLSSPTRLVLDIDQAELPSKVIQLPGGHLGPLPYQNIRLGQFDATTVRVVIESPVADRLNVSLGRGTNHLLRVYAPHSSGIATRFFNRVLGHRPHPQAPQIAYNAPARSVRSDLRTPFMGPPMMYSATPPNRFKIVDIARSQLGVSKAVDRNYVNNTFSLGKDQAWCADFVSTILNWAGGSPWGHTALVRDIYDWGLANQRFKPFPEPGDVAVFRFSVSGFDHTAIVESIQPDRSITTIGGNEGTRSGTAPGGMVQRTRYQMEDPRILGYVAPF
ncbi:CHAP domain-containing protein [Vampirovibrio sp.]|uniref:CHAP domain-containing protein n=1 Tax=Vampirovibrio sp. TaxID=2717857 RepID=UPI003593D888